MVARGVWPTRAPRAGYIGLCTRYEERFSAVHTGSIIIFVIFHLLQWKQTFTGINVFYFMEVQFNFHKETKINFNRSKLACYVGIFKEVNRFMDVK